MDYKPLLLIIAFLLAMPAAHAVNVFTASSSNCNADGTSDLALIYNGNQLPVSAIKVTAKFGDETQISDIKGKWFQSNAEVQYIRQSALEDMNAVHFIADPSSFTKKGKFTVFFDYPRTNLVGDRSKIQTQLPCPGLVCSSNIQCRDDEQCLNKTCVSLNCNPCLVGIANRCVSKCDDKNPCTVDLCNEGSCSHDKIPDCCKTEKDCFDGKACTTDTCINSRCVRDPIVCKASTDPCTKGVCKEPVGCEYKANQLCAANNAERQYVLNVGEPEVRTTSGSFLGKIFAYLAALFR